MSGAIKSACPPCHTRRRAVRSGLLFSLGLLILLAPAMTAYAREINARRGQFARRPLGGGQGVVAPKEADVRALEPGRPIERDLAAGEAHSYTLTLAAGQYAQVVVDQRGINVAVSAFDAGGKKIVEADGFPVGESESISLVAEASTTYRLEVRSSDKTAPKG